MQLGTKIGLAILVLGVVLMLLAWVIAKPLPEAQAAEVTASWYGEELRGSKTASGELFDPDGFTAAHKTLPIGTRLQVCDDACTEVRVNDRGPFTAGRDLDLSRAAATAVGLEGVEGVEIKQTSSKPTTELPKTGGR